MKISSRIVLEAVNKVVKDSLSARMVANIVVNIVGPYADLLTVKSLCVDSP